MIETRLECDHLLYWRSLAWTPKMRTRVWCQHCKDMRAVVSMPGAWTAQCRGCRQRVTRMSPEAIRDWTVRHIQTTGHEVKVADHSGTVSVVVKTPHAARDPATTRQKSENRSRIAPPRGNETLF